MARKKINSEVLTPNGSEEKIFQVSEFNEYINFYLRQAGQIIVEGEISQINISKGMWIFMTIKDKDSSVDIFSVTSRISGHDLLQVGMKVHVYGTPGVYKKSGRFNISAEKIVPAGEGALRLAFERLKAKLANEGLFAEERKRTLPKFPEKIGLITAKDSRAYGDFIKVLKNRMGGIKIYFYPVNVQGKGSVESIVEAFNCFNDKYSHLDLLILIRGGGSIEDLQSFNDELVARAIFSSKIPVVCGIGHEDDETIADYVADQRASTPSNAAEIIVRDREEVIKEVNSLTKFIQTELNNIFDNQQQRLNTCVNSLLDIVDRKISEFHNTIGNFSNYAILYFRKISKLYRTTSILEGKLTSHVFHWIDQKRANLESTVRLLNSMDFRNVLKRGFSITRGVDGKIVRSYREAHIGDMLTTSLFDGTIESNVSKTD